MKKKISMVLKILIFVCSVVGITLSAITRKSIVTTFMFFTNQSNTWIGLTCLMLFVINVLEIKQNKVLVKKWMYILKYIFTVSISLTGLVFCVLLAPTSTDFINPWSIESLLVHVTVPTLSIIDLFIEEKRFDLNLKHTFIALIPPTWYLLFSTIGFFCNWDFGYGFNYPYFFLDWGNPVGIFNIKNIEPYLGTFYWIMILLILVYSISYLYFALLRKKRCYEHS